MTWNILVGGGGRLSAILSVIQRAAPDVLTLQELRGFTRHSGRKMCDVAEALGMTAHLAPSVFGQPVAVLVRPPLLLSGKRSVRWRLHHAAAVAQVGPLTVVSTHLNPFSPQRRYREARWLGARYGSRRRPVLIAGDLNSLDPGTDHTETVSRLAPRYRSRHVTPSGEVDTRAIAAFASAGFTDLGLGSGPTAPTKGLGGPEFSGMRLDYLLASPALARRFARAEVLRGDETEYASDHYPVVAEFIDID